MEQKPQFDFYEVVRIRTSDPQKLQLNGEKGAVLGITETEDHTEPFLYAVSIDSLKECWCFFEGELEQTGERRSRSDYFSGKSIRVVVDEHGNGSLADQ